MMGKQMSNTEWQTKSGLNDEERRILAGVCEEVGVPCSIVEQMIAAEQSVYGMGRRHGIREALEILISKGVTEMEEEV